MELTPNLERQSNTVSAPNFYLRAQIRFLLDNLDHIKPSRIRGKVQDRLRDLAKELRDSKGIGNWWALIVAMGCMVGFISLAYLLRPKLVFYAAPEDKFRVISQESDYSFVLQQVHDGIPRVPAVYHFCDSEARPRFQVGETLNQLIYEDKGECQRLARGIAYVIDRDEKGWPKLAGNCANLGVGKPVVCEGKPKW